MNKKVLIDKAIEYIKTMKEDDIDYPTMGNMLESFGDKYVDIFCSDMINFMNRYKKLSDDDKERFDLLYNNYKKNNNNSLYKKKVIEKIQEDFRGIKDINGNQYLTEEFIKNKFKDI